MDPALFTAERNVQILMLINIRMNLLQQAASRLSLCVCACVCVSVCGHACWGIDLKQRMMMIEIEKEEEE